MLFIVKLCLVIIENGYLVENCERWIGNICLFICNKKYILVIDFKNIICIIGGVWSLDI